MTNVTLNDLSINTRVTAFRLTVPHRSDDVAKWGAPWLAVTWGTCFSLALYFPTCGGTRTPLNYLSVDTSQRYVGFTHLPFSDAMGWLNTRSPWEPVSLDPCFYLTLYCWLVVGPGLPWTTFRSTQAEIYWYGFTWSLFAVLFLVILAESPLSSAFLDTVASFWPPNRYI